MFVFPQNPQFSEKRWPQRYPGDAGKAFITYSRLMTSNSLERKLDLGGGFGWMLPEEGLTVEGRALKERFIVWPGICTCFHDLWRVFENCQVGKWHQITENTLGVFFLFIIIFWRDREATNRCSFSSLKAWSSSLIKKQRKNDWLIVAYIRHTEVFLFCAPNTV